MSLSISGFVRGVVKIKAEEAEEDGKQKPQTALFVRYFYSHFDIEFPCLIWNATRYRLLTSPSALPWQWSRLGERKQTRESSVIDGKPELTSRAFTRLVPELFHSIEPAKIHFLFPSIFHAASAGMVMEASQVTRALCSIASVFSCQTLILSLCRYIFS